ncbi:MAG: precorrin-2 dehydrogenase/sirohydrochlorin ferrochelatase family protein, partial [Anaerolineae bacterium]
MTGGDEAREGVGSAFYPVMLRLQGQRCLVVGAGDVAARKVEALLACGAEVVVVAPEVGEALQALAEAGQVTVHQRPFRPSDLSGCRLAIAATDRPEVNRAVAEEARKAGIWVNVVDEPTLCDFVAPAVVRRGPVVVAIST